MLLALATWGFGHLLSIANFLLALAFVSFILRSKRPPGSTLAWLFFVLLVPYIGIPFYLFLSNRKFRTRFQKKNVLYTPRAGARDSPSAGVERILDAMGLPPARTAQTELLSNGEQAYAHLVGLLEGATSSVELTTFIFSDDAVGASIETILERKAQEGVQVRILLDSMGSLWVRGPSFKKLKAAGGLVAYFNPVFHWPWRGRTNQRNHRKILVVDGTKAVLGGMNIAGEYMGPLPDPERWLDLALLCEGPAVQDIRNVFEEDWNFAAGAAAAERPVRAPAQDPGAGNASLQIVGSGPDVGGDPLYDTLLSLIYGARERVWIATPYFIPDESLCKALELAGKRGVDVRLLVPRRSNHFIADLARGSYLRQISQSACRVAFTGKMLHAKALLVDRSLGLLGSANFDMRSLLLNYEIGALLRAGEVPPSLEAWFAARFADSEAFAPASGPWKDLAEGVGRVLGPLI